MMSRESTGVGQTDKLRTLRENMTLYVVPYCFTGPILTPNVFSVFHIIHGWFWLVAICFNVLPILPPSSHGHLFTEWNIDVVIAQYLAVVPLL